MNMESRKMDRGCTKTPPPHPVPVIMALPVQLSPHGTLRVPSNEYVLVHRTDSGNIQALQSSINEKLEPRRLDFNAKEDLPSTVMCDDEYLPSSLAEALAVDSGSEIDEWEDYDDIDLRRILEAEEVNKEEEIVPDVELLHERVPENVLTWCEDFDKFTGVEEFYEEQSGPTI
ncbi:uncharacterized protein LOC105842611 [Bombyx mori]|uniref:Uncharacterized protein n=1 Tax=Bombyx mori TaxID=7091 RepID=A0A8R2C9Y6_BOMMO|nr:uncharacterized protein LOC105842611 isoform X1 [Bombyx mori]